MCHSRGNSAFLPSLPRPLPRLRAIDLSIPHILSISLKMASRLALRSLKAAGKLSIDYTAVKE